jgi:hypothetical protein
VTTTERFHPTCAPCELWPTKHKCYQCACAAAAEGDINDIALALLDAGVDCEVEQTGGFTMVVYVYAKGDRRRFIAVSNDGCGYGERDEQDEYIDDRCVNLLNLSDEPVTADSLRQIVEAVRSNLHRLA